MSRINRNPPPPSVLAQNRNGNRNSLNATANVNNMNMRSPSAVMPLISSLSARIKSDVQNWTRLLVGIQQGLIQSGTMMQRLNVDLLSRTAQVHSLATRARVQDEIISKWKREKQDMIELINKKDSGKGLG